MTSSCSLCGESFSFMQMHSSAGTITKDVGCAMYEELLLKKRQLPILEKELKSLEEAIPFLIKTKHIVEEISNQYKEINDARIHLNETKNRIDFIENEYLKNFCNNPEFAEKRERIRKAVLG